MKLRKVGIIGTGHVVLKDIYPLIRFHLNQRLQIYEPITLSYINIP